MAMENAAGEKMLIRGESLGGGKIRISRINGETVPVKDVGRAAGILLDIHGQTESYTLLQKKNHLEILDRYGDAEITPVRNEVAAMVRRYREKKKEYEALVGDAEKRQRELDFLQYELREAEEIAPRKGEEEELEKKHRKMASARNITADVAEMRELFGGDGGLMDGIGQAARAAMHLAGLDPDAAGLSDQIQELEALVQDAERAVADYAEETEFDPQEMEETEERLDRIRSLYAKHGGNYEAFIRFQEEAEEQLDRLVNFEQYEEELRNEIRQTEEKILERCRVLGGLRRRYGEQFAEEVCRELVDLNFLQVQFRVEVQEEENFSERGKDRVFFRISLNPGEPLRPLSEIASGGELSRIMLGIQSVMADSDEIDTLIFDEIDAGISGRTAEHVAEKLADLARERQLIAITHLAQIAAMGDTHFLIEKTMDEGKTHTEITELDEEGKITELARILGGVSVTQNVLESAREMKALAEKQKNLKTT